MTLSTRGRKRDTSQTALAFAIALTLGVAKPALAEATAPRAPMVVPVSNCNDDGPGSLRDAVFQAVSGETIDASQLTCSTITLATGRINIGQTDLALRGPGRDNLAIVANYHAAEGGGVILHAGTGLLTISSLTVEKGAVRGADGGGCIRSNGSVTLHDAAVQDCVALCENSNAIGGGISAHGVVELDHTLVMHSRAYCVNAGFTAQGGGIFSQGGLVMLASRLTQSRVQATPSRAYCAGALVTGGSVVIDGSSIDNNASGFGTDLGNVGGICASAGSKYGLTISNSTIADNTATGAFGGVYSNTLTKLRNSTIALNSSSDPNYASGLHMQNAQADLESSIIANNQAGASMLDLAGAGAYLSISGYNNLMTSSTIAPSDTLFDNPQLSVLADNGGPTPTIAIAGWSPAVDRGNNNAGLSNDQRGPGFPRVASAAADIGAFETRGDLIFRNGFDPSVHPSD